jgi:hypothetical protein
LSNVVLVWDTVYIAKMVAQLRAASETVLDEDLARISPLAYSQVIPNASQPWLVWMVQIRLGYSSQLGTSPLGAGALDQPSVDQQFAPRH